MASLPMMMASALLMAAAQGTAWPDISGPDAGPSFRLPLSTTYAAEADCPRIGKAGAAIKQHDATIEISALYGAGYHLGKKDKVEIERALAELDFVDKIAMTCQNDDTVSATFYGLSGRSPIKQIAVFVHGNRITISGT